MNFIIFLVELHIILSQAVKGFNYFTSLLHFFRRGAPSFGRLGTFSVKGKESNVTRLGKRSGCVSRERLGVWASLPLSGTFQSGAENRTPRRCRDF